MKKITILSAAALMLFAACQKDGKYNPKEKIAKVSEEYVYSYNDEWNNYYDSVPKHVTEEWTWDGKELSQIAYIDIDYDENGNIVPDGQDIIKFTYDGGQLSEVTGEDGRMVFTYDGKKLQKAELYENSSTAFMTYTFTHDGKKISSITMESDMGFDKKGSFSSRLESLLLGNFIPESKSTEKVIKDLHAKAAKGETITMNLTWDGDNVSKISAVTPFGNASINFTYDNKNNPYKGFALMFGGYGESETGVEFCNKNNITKIVASYVEGDYAETEEENYSYTYDGEWPLSRTEEYHNEAEGLSYHNKRTVYFEYK